MKNVKKALMATTLAGALAVSAGYGTYSWFTSSSSATGTIQNGTLSVNNGKAVTTPLFSHSNFAPSQIVPGDFITLDNTGSLDQVLKLTYKASIDKAGVSAAPYKIYYLAFKYAAKPSGDVLKDYRMAWEKGFYNGATNPSIASSKAVPLPKLPAGVEAFVGEVDPEAAAPAQQMMAMAATDDSGTKEYKIGNDKFFTLKDNQYIDIAFDVKLAAKAGNEYQGVKYTANLTVQAKQTDSGAKFDKE
ncbi:TasA family protein [Peribacillus kribbensis]|uniref:TasA family protein n=1 Tax=Peribacillus kribbensis TaxID=356658 RepID=UPI0004163784|nr:TasA family protein [Peribacillus kribbensis]